MSVSKIQAGQRFDRLVTIKKIDERKHGCAVWLCKCDCGNETTVRSDLLKSGKVKSCGCLHDAQATKNIAKQRHKFFIENTHIGRIKNIKPQSNNTSGVSGVAWHKKIGKWQARICFQRKFIFLGYFGNIEEAKKARQEAEEKYFKTFLDNLNKD